jgi:glycerol-3-phosphate acyltransferase PlsY
MMSVWVATVGGYLLGSLSFARVLARLFVPADRLAGTSLSWGDDEGFTSTNVSATTLRQIAPRLGPIAAILDIAKAAIPVAVLRFGYPDEPYAAVFAAAVTIGHVFPVFHRFRGGRGTSTILGAVLVLDPVAFPITLIAGYVIGLYVFKDVLLAHHAGWIVLLPVWFGLSGRWDLVAFALVVNVVRWSVSGPEIREWLAHRRSGALQTREFHDEIERIHIGYIHGFLRRHGWIHYPYMDEPEP